MLIHNPIDSLSLVLHASHAYHVALDILFLVQT